MKLHEIADEDTPLIYKLLARALAKGTRVIFYDYGRELCEITRVNIDRNDLDPHNPDTMWVDLRTVEGNDDSRSKGYHIPMHIDQLELRPQKDGSLELVDTDQEQLDREMGRIP